MTPVEVGEACALSSARSKKFLFWHFSVVQSLICIVGMPSVSYFCVKPKAGEQQVAPKDFFGLWMPLCQEFRDFDDTVQLDSGEFCVVRCCAVGKFVCSCEELCDCTERAVLFVHVLDKQPGHALLRNRELGITSDKFVTVSQQSTIVSCCKPASVVRKCFRWRKQDVDYVTPMPTRHELD